MSETIREHKSQKTQIDQHLFICNTGNTNGPQEEQTINSKTFQQIFLETHKGRKESSVHTCYLIT